MHFFTKVSHIDEEIGIFMRGTRPIWIMAAEMEKFTQWLDLRTIVLQDIVSSLRLAIHSNPEQWRTHGGGGGAGDKEPSTI